MALRKRNSDEILEEIRDRLDKCSHYGTYLLASCPFHSPDKHPSFFVYADWYSCRSCGERGRTENLLERLTGVYIHKTPVSTFNPFPEWLRRFGGLTEALVAAYRNGKAFPVYMEYVRNRGIVDTTIQTLKLGYLDGWITIPVFQSKRIVGATTRMIQGEARYFNPKEQNSSLLFIPNETLVRESDWTYLVFGMFDAITLFQLGVPVITTLNGIKAKPEPFAEIRKKIIIIPDRGEEKTASRLAAKLDWRGKLKVLDYPIGAKDINDLHKMGVLNEIFGK